MKIFSSAVLGTCLLVLGCAVYAQGQDARGFHPAGQPKSADLVIVESGAVIPEAPVPVLSAGDPFYAPVAMVGRQTLHDRFMAYAVITIGPRALASPAIPAELLMAWPPNHYPREWRQGAVGFGRNYGDALASEASLQSAKFATGALLHEDFRYRPSSSTNLLARGAHALTFTLIDRSDSGHKRIALANFAGAAAAGYVRNLYLPHGFDDAAHANTRMGVRFGGIAINNVLREFSPEIFRLTNKLHVPFPRIPLPEWWIRTNQVPHL